MNINILDKRPLLIAGPCSAETEEQVLATAQQLKQNSNISIFRAGIWKPRTRPGNFEGIGSIGLQWLNTVQQEVGLPVAIEIANPKQVEEALKHNIDMLWIGARTTVNPFSVQDIADALKGSDVPVLIKNPINPDLELWTGATERLQNAGLTQIGFIHRGFSSYGNAQLRNVPMWNLAIEMKRRFPQLPFLIDPSHITGNSALIAEIFQKAIDLDYDGAMIEAHITPKEAWSDAKQQVTPAELTSIINAINWRKSEIQDQSTNEHLLALRQRIDQLDNQLVAILQERMQVSEQIGTFKKSHNITILQTQRWNDIYSRLQDLAAKANLSPEFLSHYMEAIHLESIRHQELVMNK